MSTVQQIKDAIEHLPQDDFSNIRDWIAERDWNLWDSQIEQDSQSGKLDFLFEEARREKETGETRPL